MKREYGNIIKQDDPILQLGPVFYAPLIQNAVDVVDGLLPERVNGTVTYSEQGARFIEQNQNYIAYRIDSRFDVLAMVLTFKQTYRSHNQYPVDVSKIPSPNETHFLIPCPFIYSNDGIIGITDCVGKDYNTSCAVSLNTINKVAISFSPNKSGPVNVYVNGVKILSSRTNYRELLPNVFIIGANWRDYTGDGTRAFDGYIKNVALFDKVLTEQQMIDLTI